MDLKEIWSKISNEAEQAAAIADIMCVFSIVSGSTSTDLPLESIPNGMIFISNTIETHSKNLSEILKQLTDYIKKQEVQTNV